MAHEVIIKCIPEFELSSKDMVLMISDHDGKIGEIHISKGNIDFWPSGNSVNHFQLSWRKFAEIMKENGAQVRMRN
ncbi:hypothetical protein [Niveispirillum fermenti]|uniref:hypothetical protein n=1 Tax=Niveispirillum fermenti TaxID=1233113 RepID=UPI003A89196A